MPRVVFEPMIRYKGKCCVTYTSIPHLHDEKRIAQTYTDLVSSAYI